MATSAACPLDHDAPCRVVAFGVIAIHLKRDGRINEHRGKLRSLRGSKDDRRFVVGVVDGKYVWTLID